MLRTKKWKNFMMILKEQWLIVTPNIKSLQEISSWNKNKRRLQEHGSIWNRGEK